MSTRCRRGCRRAQRPNRGEARHREGRGVLELTPRRAVPTFGSWGRRRARPRRRSRRGCRPPGRLPRATAVGGGSRTTPATSQPVISPSGAHAQRAHLAPVERERPDLDQRLARAYLRLGRLLQARPRRRSGRGRARASRGGEPGEDHDALERRPLGGAGRGRGVHRIPVIRCSMAIVPQLSDIVVQSNARCLARSLTRRTPTRADRGPARALRPGAAPDRSYARGRGLRVGAAADCAPGDEVDDDAPLPRPARERRDRAARDGTAKVNRLRREDLDARFPGLLDSVLSAT